MSDINPMWRIKMLTETFGMCGIGWKIEITDKRLEKGFDVEIVCFVDINLYVKVDGEWSAPIPGMGGSSFTTAERNGVYTSDECYKMAYTDAISVACKSLGFAADVYFANDRTKYSQKGDEPAQPTQPQQTAQKTPQSVPQPTPQQSQPQAQQSRSNVPHSFKSEAYRLRIEHHMEWNELQKVAERVLGRKLKKVTELQDDKEWEQIVNELKSFNLDPALPF
jgi:hypothetical protein